MRRAAIVLLAAALCLSCAACGFGQSEPARPKPGAPAATPTPEPTPTPTPEPTPFTAVQHPTSAEVYTDWSGLADFAPIRETYTRLSPEPMETLRPGDYGRLLPYPGVYRFAEGEYSWQLESLWGLVTQTGQIVLDPVCSSVRQLSYFMEPLGSISCPFLVLERMFNLPDAPDASEWNRGWVSRFAVCAPDGRWSTDFIYEGVQGSALGAICIRSGEENLAECLSENGTVVFSTADWNVRGEMNPWAVYNLSALTADNFAPVYLEPDGVIFVNARGETLSVQQKLRLDDAQPFSEGLAAVCVDGKWGFLDENGAIAIEPRYDGVSYGGFVDGRALVYTGRFGRSYLIDRAGNVLLEDANIGREIRNGVGWYHCFSTGGPDRWYDAGLRPVTVGGLTPTGCWTELGLFTVSEDGVRVLPWEDELRFYPGAESVSDFEGFTVVYMGDSCQVFDEANRLVLSLSDSRWPTVVRDAVTGERYIFVWTEDGGYDVYTARGGFLLRARDWSAPIGGLFACSDNLTTGYKNAAGEWVFRVRVDQAD